MTNRAERRRSMKTAELRIQAIEALGQTPYFDLEGDNDPDVVVRVWHPLLVDDDTQVRLDRFNAGADLDQDPVTGRPKNTINGELAEPANIRSARAILGDEEHARFIAAGGHSNDVQLAWNLMVSQQQGTVFGNADEVTEDDPKSVTP